VLAYVLACASAVPVLRPWEYFNEFVGGTKNGYKYFSDEGVDLGQRTKEIVDYYRKFLKPAGEMPTLIYESSDEELKGRDVEYLGRDMQRDLKQRPVQFSLDPCSCLRTLSGIGARFGRLLQRHDSGMYSFTRERFSRLGMRRRLSIFMESKNIMRISRTMPPQKRRFSNLRKWIPPPFLSTSSLGTCY